MRTSRRLDRGAVSARLSIALLALALAVLLWRSLVPGARHAPSGAGSPEAARGAGGSAGTLSAADSAGSDADIERALALARASAPPPDSTAIKNAWHDEVRGVDLAGLNEAQRALLLRFANAERCTCGCGYTLAGCLASDMTCEISRGNVAALLDSIRAGHITSARGMRKRPSTGG
jgi:hypothetical protein